MKNYDSWKLFELFHELEESGYKDEEDIECASWNGYETQFDFGNTIYAFVAKCEIYAVLYGTEKAIEKYKQGLVEETLELSIIKYMEVYINVLNRYRAEREISENEQLKELMRAIHDNYKNEERTVGDCMSQEPLSLELVKASALLSDAPAFVVKGIAEIYNKEFWDLWKQMELGGLRYFEELYNQGKYYITPLSIAGFLNKDHNDMIYFWNEKAGFDFSQGLYIWFELLKMKFSYVIKDEGTYLKAFKEEPLRHIVDKRYWALWKIYEDMVWDPQLIKAGSVIFASEGKENRRNGFWEYKRKSKKVLIDDWVSIPKEKKNNDGRKILRRYMALMANKKLRHKVFGF